MGSTVTAGRELMRTRLGVFALFGLLAAGRAAAVNWPTYAGGPHRLFFNPHPGSITAANVAALRVTWTFHVGGPVTASPSVVTLPLPGEGRIPIAFLPSWDHTLYAL